MKTWVYRTLLGLCAAVALAGCVSISIGLKNKYDNYQAEVTKQKAKDIVENVMDSTVRLIGYNEKGEIQGGGTGFVIAVDDQGSWIITNKHVCMMSLMNQAEVKKSEGVFRFIPIVAVPRRGRPSGAAVTRIAQNSDLCLIRTELKFKKPLKIAKKIKKGDEIVTFGFPGGKAEVNRGKYLGTTGEALQFYSHTDAKIWYGASGSAAVNSNGEVVGVMSNIRFNRAEDKKKPFKREDVAESLFIPLEILREFIGGN